MSLSTPVRLLYTSVKELGLQSPVGSVNAGGAVSHLGYRSGNVDEDRREEDAMRLLYSQLPRVFISKRHVERIEAYKAVAPAWRMKERMKTVSVALVLCLNVGVDPPDVVKIFPCARLECWIDPLQYADPLSTNNIKAVEAVGNALQRQYERWQPRARYKLSLDPTIDEVKKLCVSLRRNAKDERVLFHYNGHGVPKPTKNGEIWVFNKQFTQYIPLSVVDLQMWMGSPSIYVYDCSNAGHIVNYIKANPVILPQVNPAASSTAPPTTSPPGIVSDVDHETNSSDRKVTSGPTSAMGCPSAEDSGSNSTAIGLLESGGVGIGSSGNCIQLAACGANEYLPMNPELPADLFTSCLTTPMQIALKWFILQKTSLLVPISNLDLLDKIPGQLNDRRTMIGELNWIFTAITDTIAWNILSKELFQKLFRQDLLVASLFRNFLLAERIMRSYNCMPVSIPRLPITFQHPMWQAWDMTLDHCLSQLPVVKDNPAAFVHSPFFAEQLTAFQVWLTYGSEKRTPPEQLPIVLQVLLSQVHRQRALELLGRFLDLGPWAVNLALSVGIFPYVLKLLQSSARDLRPLLVFIWAKLLAVDTSCQADLVKDAGHKYFLAVLSDNTMPAEHRTMAAFVLTIIVDNYFNGQEVAHQGNLIAICLEQLSDPHPLLRQWSALCLGKVWTNYDDARWCGVRDSAHVKLAELLADPLPEVRAATVFALGTFISNTTERSEQANNIDHGVAVTLLTVVNDGSHIVRRELVVALSGFVRQFENQFISVAQQTSEEENAREYHTVTGTTGVWNHPNDAALFPSGAGGSMRRSSSSRCLKGISDGTVDALTDLSPTTGAVGSAIKVGATTLMVSGATGGMRRVVTHNSSFLSSGYGNVYTNVWRMLQLLMSDAFPGVADLAKKLCNHIKNKAQKSMTFTGHQHPMLPQHRKMSAPLSALPQQITSPSSTTSPQSSQPNSPSNKPITFLMPRNQTQTDGLSGGMDTSRSSGGAHRLEHSATLPRLHHTNTSIPAHLTRTRKIYDRNSENNTISEKDGAADEYDTSLQSMKTDFFAWCCRYFTEPLMRVMEEQDPEGPARLERDYRFMRAARAQLQAVQEQRRNRSLLRLDNLLFNTRNVSIPSSLRFHPYEPHLAVTDKDHISVYDWEQGSRLSTFSNRNQRHTRVTYAEFINVHDQALLMTGSDDGVVKIFRNYCPDDGSQVSITGTTTTPTLVSAWQALSDMIPMAKGSGMVMDYDPTHSILYASGDVKSISCWDIQKERKVQEFATGADSCMTSLCLNRQSPEVLVGACGDGTVRVFDIRIPPTGSVVQTFREHPTWVVKAYTLQSYANRVVSASTNGDIRIWDIRAAESLYTIDTPGGLTALDAHQYCDIIASGSVQQWINVYGHSGETLSTIKYHEGFMGQRIGQVTCLAFHPLKVKLAIGSMDQCISVYSSTTADVKKR